MKGDLRDILERAHCCEELLNYVALVEATAPRDRPYQLDFEGLWECIERHDWLTWLMRNCPDQFEDSWRDCVSALHAVADACTGDPDQHGGGVEVCDLIRQYIRLRHD